MWKLLCSSCLKLLNIHTVLYFSIPKEHVLLPHISFLLIKEVFLLSYTRALYIHIYMYDFFLWVYFHTQREKTLFIYLRRNLEIPGLTSLQTLIKWKFWKQEHFAIFDCLSTPRVLCFSLSIAPALSIHRPHGLCALLIHHSAPLHFLLFYSEQVCTHQSFFYRFPPVIFTLATGLLASDVCIELILFGILQLVII